MDDFDGPASLDLDRLLHPKEQDRFRALCTTTELADLPGLRLRVITYLATVENVSPSRPGLVDVDTARRVAGVLSAILDDPNELSAEGRALVRGAVEYFVLDEDDLNDLTDLIGFDDDARVLNSVVRAINRNDLHLELS